MKKRLKELKVLSKSKRTLNARKVEKMENYQENAENLLKKMGVKMTVKQLDYAKPEWDTEYHDNYRITLSRNGKRFSVRFYQSIASAGQEPTAYDLLASITKYEPEDFEWFCSEFGYDTDSRKAEKTYKAVVKEWEKVSEFFTEAELAELREIS